MRGCLQGLTSALPEVVMLWPRFFFFFWLQGGVKGPKNYKEKRGGS